MNGFKALKKILMKLKNDESIVFMEATGNYYEQLAHVLFRANIKVCIVLPNKIKAFGKSFNQKAKTDKIDAELIANYGLERIETLWDPPSETARRMKEKTREHQNSPLESEKKNPFTRF